jgi:tetratricopeptide (TPR) repeat protein
MKIIILFLLLLAVLPLSVRSNEQKKELEKRKSDTAKINFLVKAADRVKETNADSAILIWKNINKLCESALKKTKLPALIYFYKKKSGENYTNLAFFYDMRGEMKKALEYNFKALKITESINDLKTTATIYNNLGYIYNTQGKPEKAVSYFKKSIKLYIQLDDKKELANTYLNLGGVMGISKQYYESLSWLRKANGIYMSVHDTSGLTITMNNIGFIYMNVNEYDSALFFFNKCLSFFEKNGDFTGLANAYINIADLQLRKNQTVAAMKNSKKALDAAIQSKGAEVIAEANDFYSQVAAINGNYKDAYEYYRKAKKMRDSISNETSKKMAFEKDIQFKYEKKTAADSLKQLNERKLVAAQRKQERLELYGLYIGIGMLVVFGIFITNRFRVTHKQKHIIQEQHQQMERQKQAVEEQNREILDSIKYASRIQKALLPRDSSIQKDLDKLNKI